MTNVAVAHSQTMCEGGLTRVLSGLLRDALRLGPPSPSFAGYLARALARQRGAARLRSRWGERGLHVPPVMLLSLADRGHARCRGCGPTIVCGSRAGLTVERVGALFQEAEDLGVCVVVLAGGEPLLRPDILQLAEGHPRVIFPLCTNGLLLSDPWIQRLRTRRHLIPVLCLNNLDPEMDIRGRVSSHRLTLERARALRAAGVFFGVSLTVTSRNAHALTDAAFVDELTAQGCRLFCYTEHIPLTPSDAELALSPGQRRLLAERIRLHRRRRKALFVSFPGDGDVYGGCLDAGRGFIHVSASGHVEPCPVASYSDQNLADTTLRSALTSQALRSLRSRAGHLGLQDGGAALFSRHEWVRPVLVREERV